MSEGGIFKTFATLDRRFIYIIIFMIVIYATISPLGLPIAVKQSTVKFRSYLTALDENDIVWAAWETGFTAWNELKAGIIATYRDVIKSGAKMVIAFGTVEDNAVLALVMGDPYTGTEGILSPELKQYDYKYGEDWVCVGYVLVNEASTSSLARDLHSVIVNDYKGKPLAGTFFDNLQNAGDFTLIIDFSPGMQTEPMIRHWVRDYNVTMIEGAIGVNISSLSPYLTTGYLKAMLESTRGCAELEYLGGVPGPGAASMDAFTIIHYVLVALIVIGNIGYFGWEKNSKQRRRIAIGGG